MNHRNDLISKLSLFHDKFTDEMLLSRGNIEESLGLVSDEKIDQLFKILSYLPPPIRHPKFGFWVKETRKMLNLPQQAIGNIVGAKRDRISKLETGKNNLAEDHLEKIRDELVSKLRQIGYL